MMKDHWTEFPYPFNKAINKKIHYKKHTIRFEIWIHHIKVAELKFTKYKEARKYMNKNYQLLYDDGGCMIYCFINKIQISYWSFMDKKYYLYE